ncbi:MAG: tetratricopeptide repeat protein [Gammaproteobacteria bacterium]
MPRPALLIAIVLVAFSGGVQAELTPDDARPGYLLALRAYEAGEFARAADLLEAAMTVAPDCARCAHLLGKSYGRLAERAGWIEAMALARKTVAALEQAVELAPDDVEALEDLLRYYRAAPDFLGGGADKAEAVEQRLRDVSGRTG